MPEEICKGTFEYSYLGIRSIKRTLQIKRSRLKEKKSIEVLILIREPKESPRRGIEPRSPA